MLAAWLSSIGFLVASAISYRWGSGLRFLNGPSPQWDTNGFKVETLDLTALWWTVAYTSQALYAVEVFYYLTIYLIKMSIFCLYLRLCMSFERLLLCCDLY